MTGSDARSRERPLSLSGSPAGHDARPGSLMSMASGAIAALAATLALGFVEGLARFYPAPNTWMRLRRLNGRRAVRAMRERLEAYAGRRMPATLAGILCALIAAWVALSVTEVIRRTGAELALDVLPYVLVVIALLRLPSALRAMAGRMRVYEKDAGEDPDAEDPYDGSNGEVVL